MQNATTILSGLPGVGVVACRARDRRARCAGAVSAPGDDGLGRGGVPVVRVISTSVKQYRITGPRDLPYGEERLGVRWRKRQYRCR
jgi:transposase